MIPVAPLDSNKYGLPKTQRRNVRPAKDPRTHCAARDQKSLPTPALEYRLQFSCSNDPTMCSFVAGVGMAGQDLARGGIVSRDILFFVREVSVKFKSWGKIEYPWLIKDWMPTFC